MSNLTQIKVIVKGRVQGVFYRANTQKTAQRLGIKGYVKNLADGSVQAVFEGDPKAVSQMVEWCRKGPEASIVDDVLTETIEDPAYFDTFEIRY